MTGKFVIDKAKNGEFYFNLHAGNGERILTSEMYKAKGSAENGIESVRKNAPLDERYVRKENKAGQPMFTLKAGNHEVIGVSEGYSSTSARENGIESVKRSAPDAVIVDNT
ncbi:hypothetical protein AWB80_00198 [Caballeronia pedi]|uniref:DUF1508 domain-containing protein n=1 Tax=Caballeronia pedi TaxID=1777141 RepID=A0A157Z438_9BURK|nr:YegP family protein [Caballeronia pedi]SAK40284.1 hypothetical protein AWB80_00198 [Caballeronia pedi]